MKEAHRPLRWRITKGELKGLHILNPGDRKGFPERGIRAGETERVLIANTCITFTVGWALVLPQPHNW